MKRKPLLATITAIKMTTSISSQFLKNLNSMVARKSFSSSMKSISQILVMLLTWKTIAATMPTYQYSKLLSEEYCCPKITKKQYA